MREGRGADLELDVTASPRQLGGGAILGLAAIAVLVAVDTLLLIEFGVTSPASDLALLVLAAVPFLASMLVGVIWRASPPGAIAIATAIVVALFATLGTALAGTGIVVFLALLIVVCLGYARAAWSAGAQGRSPLGRWIGVGAMLLSVPAVAGGGFFLLLLLPCLIDGQCIS